MPPLADILIVDDVIMVALMTAHAHIAEMLPAQRVGHYQIKPFAINDLLTDWTTDDTFLQRNYDAPCKDQ